MADQINQLTQTILDAARINNRTSTGRARRHPELEEIARNLCDALECFDLEGGVFSVPDDPKGLFQSIQGALDNLDDLIDNIDSEE